MATEPSATPRSFLPLDRSWASVPLIALALSACGLDLPLLSSGSASLSALSTAVRNGACPVGDDQADSFLPRLSQAADGPVTVVVDSQFSISEREMIEAAAETWNAWGRGALGHDVFVVTSGSLDSSGAPTSGSDPCNFDSPVSGGGFAIRRGMKQSSWESFGLSEANPAATLRCRSGDSLTQQVMVVQADWLDSRQFQSVVLHEMGHSLGLDHSCDNEEGSDGFVGCASLPSDHEYRSAVMYPSLKSRLSVASEDGTITTEPEIRDDLTSNDADRASCLYLYDQDGGAFSVARTSGGTP